MKILLTDLRSHNTAELFVSPKSKLEDLVPRIKVNLQLPYVDHGWHRFMSHGCVYCILGIWYAYSDFMYECYENWDIPHWRDSETTNICSMFTTLGSSFIYEQDSSTALHRVRITLLSR